MSSAIPGIPGLSLSTLPASKSGLVSATNPNDPNRAILQVEQNFTEILKTLQVDSSGQNSGNTSSNSFDSNFNFATGVTGSPSSATGNYDIFSTLSNSFASIGNSSLSGVQSTQQTLASFQRLAALSDNSPLLGEWIQYANAGNNEYTVAKVRKILLDANGVPQIELDDGTLISPNQVTGLAKDPESMIAKA